MTQYTAKLFTLILTLCVFSAAAHSATESTVSVPRANTLYPILPTSQVNPKIAPNSFSRISYQVFNRTSSAKYIVVRGPAAPGYRPLQTDPNDCRLPQLLEPNESCNYRLMVTASLLSSNRVSTLSKRITACSSDSYGNPTTECSMTPVRDEPDAVVSSTASTCEGVCSCSEPSSNCRDHLEWSSFNQCRAALNSSCEESTRTCSANQDYTGTCGGTRVSTCSVITDSGPCDSSWSIKEPDESGWHCTWNEEAQTCTESDLTCAICR